MCACVCVCVCVHVSISLKGVTELVNILPPLHEKFLMSDAMNDQGMSSRDDLEQVKDEE